MALLRYHLKMDVKTWEKMKFSQDQILQMWCELIYCKKQLGEWKDEK